MFRYLKNFSKLVFLQHDSKLCLLNSKLSQICRISSTTKILYSNNNEQNTGNEFANQENKVNLIKTNDHKNFIFTGNKNIDGKLDRLMQKLYQLMSIYEEMIGLKELKEAQQSVIQAEEKFIKAQEIRRSLSTEILNIQIKLKELRDQMDRLNRTDSNYLKLFTQEHENLNEEKILQHEYKLKESEERDLFFHLSALLRESQEKERARAERIKYLQLTLSIACTCLGLLSALFISFLRRSEIKEILNTEKESFHTLVTKLDNFDKEQHDLNENLKKVYLTNNDNSKEILNSNEILSKQNAVLIEHYKNFNFENGFNKLHLEKNINKQQDLLKIISVTTVLSACFLCIMYFRGN